MANEKRVYFFGNGKAEGTAKMKEVLGGKGANLAEMTNLGIPVPPGFTIGTNVCAAYYENNKKYPEGLEKEVLDNLAQLEKAMGKKTWRCRRPSFGVGALRCSCLDAGHDGHHLKLRNER